MTTTMIMKQPRLVSSSVCADGDTRESLHLYWNPEGSKTTRASHECDRKCELMAPLYPLKVVSKAHIGAIESTAASTFVDTHYNDISLIPASPATISVPSGISVPVKVQKRRNSATGAESSIDIPLSPMYPPLPPTTRSRPQRRAEPTVPTTAYQQWGASPVRKSKKAVPPLPTSSRPKSLFHPTQASYTVHVPKPTSVLRHSQSLPINKTLSFAAQDSIRDIDMVSDMTPNEIADMWWSAREYTAIRNDYETVVYLMEQHARGQSTVSLTEGALDELYCTRGLHQRTEQGAWRLYERQRNARNAVLDAQERHSKSRRRRGSTGTWNTATCDVAMEIAQVYGRETRPLRDEAWHTAAQDAAAIASYLNRTQRPTPFVATHSEIAVVCSPASPSKGQEAPTHRQTRSSQSESQGTLSTSHSDLHDTMKPCDDKDTIGSNSHTTQYAHKKVQFSNVIGIMKNRKVNDLTKDCQRRWYSSKELARVKAVADALVLQIERQTAGQAALVEMDSGANWMEAEQDECPRGLEQCTTQAKALQLERRRAAWVVVRDGSDSEQVALLYSQVTQEAGREAMKMGKHDAKEAKKLRLRRRSTQCTKATTLLNSSGLSTDDTVYTNESLVGSCVRRSSCNDASRVNGTLTAVDAKCNDNNHDSIHPIHGAIMNQDSIVSSIQESAAPIQRPKFRVPNLNDSPSQTKQMDKAVSPSTPMRQYRQMAPSSLSPCRTLL